jgi:O-antigen/teichoic acid export membrane protein
MTTTPAEKRRLIQGVVVVGLGLAVPQGLAYVTSVVAARTLDQASFGAFGAILNSIQIGVTVALGMQALIARRVASMKNYGSLLKFALEVSLIVLIGVAILSYPLSYLFDIEYWILFLALASLAPFVFISAQAGVAQGNEFFFRLAGIYIVLGLGRSMFAIIGLLINPTLEVVAYSFFFGMLISAFVGHFILGSHRKFIRAKRINHEYPGLVKATQALLALYVLVNVDVLLARVVLPAEESGIYSVGMLVAKIAFFLPQAVTVVLFPRMGNNDSSALRLALFGTSSIGLLYVMLTYFASDFVVNSIGGSGYEILYKDVWLFALEGTLFAILQVLLYGRIAREDTSVSIILWVGSILASLSVVFIFSRTIENIVLILIVTTFILTIIAAITEKNHRANSRKGSSHT